MKYLTKKNQFDNVVVFDGESKKSHSKSFSKEEEKEIDSILMPIIQAEIEKIRNGTSDLLKGK